MIPRVCLNLRKRNLKKQMKRIAVMHMLDTLEAGGAERVAVTLVNHLPRDRYSPYLCTTRREGPLAESVAADVGRLALNRRHTFDRSSMRRLIDFIRENEIQILHAHGSTLFIARIASLFATRPAVVWHAHYGRLAVEDRPARAHRLMSWGIGGVITVNHALADWAKRRLRVPADRVWYIANFVSIPAPVPGARDLPGAAGSRIVCSANIRAEKDHVTLIRAMARVVREYPAAHLLLMGRETDTQCVNTVRQEISRQGLEGRVHFLGQRRDVPAVLRACDIGVLSSASEGLPMSLLEYGAAGLPAVATRVGQCAEVLDQGRAGILVPPASPELLANALVQLLRSPERRTGLADAFQCRIRNVYSPDAVMGHLCQVYSMVLGQVDSQVTAAGYTSGENVSVPIAHARGSEVN